MHGAGTRQTPVGKSSLYARFDTSNVFGASKTSGARVQLLIFPRHTLSTSTLRLAPPRHSPLFRLYQGGPRPALGFKV
jgi:hypothetical protein